MKKICMLFSAMFCAFSLMAQYEDYMGEFSVDGINYNIIGENSVEVTDDYEAYSGDLIIPAAVSYGGVTYSVTAIGESAFEDCSKLTSVSIPNSVLTIYENAFAECTKLVSLHIPASVKKIHELAVYGCSSLTSITVASGNAYYDSRENCNAVICKATNTLVFGCQKTTIPKTVTSIGYGAFALCNTLYSIVIPNSVTSIGSYAFYECEYLEEIHVPASVTFIGEEAFGDTEWYSDLPNGVVYINNVLYNYKGSMPENHFVVVKPGTVSISPNAFAYETDLTHVTFANSVTRIGKGAFRGCSSLVSVVLPSKLRELEYDMFYNCTSLRSAQLPNGLKKIGSNAFYNCYSLSSITIPKTVRRIEESAFDECTNLEKTNYTGDIADWCSIVFEGIDANPIYASRNLHIKGDMVLDMVIPSTVDSISAYAFAGLETLNSVIIPNSVKRIGYYAFNDCEELSVVSYAGDVASWCNIEFKNISSNPLLYSYNFCVGGDTIVDLVIPSTVQKIGDYAFVGCGFMESVTIPKSVKYVGYQAFGEVDGLGKTIYSGDVANWCDIVFASLESNPMHETENLYIGSMLLSDLELPSSVDSVLAYSFINCTSLRSVSVPSSVKYIDEYAFNSGCTALKEIVWNASSCIGEFPFDNIRTQIGSLTFGDSVVYIPENLCAGMSSLKEVTLPTSVKVIAAGAFANCSSLQRTNYLGDIETWCSIEFGNANSNPIYQSSNLYINGKEVRELFIPESVTQVNDYAFLGCRSLVNVSLPSTIRRIGLSAFEDCIEINKTSYSGDVASWCCIEFANATSNPMIYSNNFYLNDIEVRDLVVPNSVSKIPSYAFLNCQSLKSVEIMDNVHSIGSSAFEGCEFITSISIPNSVTNIVRDAFNECTSLNTVVWNAGSYAGSYPFDAIRAQITTLTFGDSIKIIPSYFCSGMNWLENVTISSSVQVVDEYAFYDCDALKTIVLGDNVTHIKEYAFYDCDRLGSITINNAVKYIGYNTFADCDVLTRPNYKGDVANWCNIYFDGSSANPISVAHKWYINDVEVRDVVIPEGVDTIGEFAFSGYIWMNSVTIPSTVNHIGWGAFLNCKSLKEITIPNSVISIGSYAFDECSSLSSVTWNANNYVGSNPFADIRTQIKTLVIGEAINEIPAAFCSGMTKLTSLTISNNVVKIGDGAFRKCDVLKMLTLPSSIKHIGNYAFDGCKSLSTLVIPEGVESVGEGAFASCSSIVRFTLPNSIRTLGGAAFKNCAALKYINMPDSIRTLGERMFLNCYSLVSIRVPKNVVDIDDYAFNNCSALDTVILSEELKTIGRNAFDGCSALSFIEIPSNVIAIGADAFEGCYMLNKVLWNAKSYTGKYPFGNRNLKVKSFIFGENVEHISSFFCNNMSNLTSILWNAKSYKGIPPLERVHNQVEFRSETN